MVQIFSAILCCSDDGTNLYIISSLALQHLSGPEFPFQVEASGDLHFIIEVEGEDVIPLTSLPHIL